MRSLKEQFTLLVVGSIVLLTLSLMLAFYFQARSTAIMAAETKARSDLATAEAIIDLKYPGPWHVKDGVLYKGKAKINNNFLIVDYIEKLTGDTCTIFMNNVRVTTTIRDKDGKRAVGTQASREVTDKVLGAREEYVGEAEVVGRLYQTAYKPLTDEGGKVLGMLYVGAPSTFYRTILYGSLKIMGLAGFFCALLIGAVTWFFVARTVVEPLQEVIQGTRNAAVHGTGRPLRVQGSTEIWELTQAFNQMLSQIRLLTDRLSKENGAPQRTDGVSGSPHQEKLQGLGGLRSEEVGDRLGEDPFLQQGDTPEAGKGEREGRWVESLLSPNGDLPKGLNRVTLKEVLLYMKQKEGEEFTIQEVSENLSLSKVTVRRYLDYLERRGLVEVEQKYGSVGRPLRIYKFRA